MVTWTVDVEFDWGGRSGGAIGIKQGLPRILEVFSRRNRQAIFFISTELVRDYKRELFAIKDSGHQIGSHGHFHQIYSRSDRSLQDAELSMLILHKTFGKADYPFRAPKFNFHTDDVFSRPVGHVSLLKHLWVGQKIKDDTILYLHPFDIVRAYDPPNLFCALWYSRPEKAFETFDRLVGRQLIDNTANSFIQKA